MRTDNAKAHAAIDGRLDGLAIKVDRLGEDAAFLRGRQDERDRSAP